MRYVRSIVLITGTFTLGGVSGQAFAGDVYGVAPNNVCASVRGDVGKMGYGYWEDADGAQKNAILLCVQVRQGKRKKEKDTRMQRSWIATRLHISSLSPLRLVLCVYNYGSFFLHARSISLRSSGGLLVEPRISLIDLRRYRQPYRYSLSAS